MSTDLAHFINVTCTIWSKERDVNSRDPDVRWIKGEIVDNDAVHVCCATCCKHVLLNAYTAFTTSARRLLLALVDLPSKEML